jgi:hypothetical protein
MAVRKLGGRGCAELVAQEFGDHPDTAVARMRWARTVVAQAFGGSGPRSAHASLPARPFLADARRAA